MTTEELAEQIGLLSDRADNFAHAAELPMPPQYHVNQLKAGMELMRDKMRELHVKATGNNPWSEQ